MKQQLAIAALMSLVTMSVMSEENALQLSSPQLKLDIDAPWENLQGPAQTATVIEIGFDEQASPSELPPRPSVAREG